MDFGKALPDVIPFIDFALPKDAALTANTLAAAGKANPFNIHVGLTKWGANAWKGQIYPPIVKDSNLLIEYVKHFNVVELNATFYKQPELENIAKWMAESAGNPDFKFCPKFPQQITHIRKLEHAEEPTAKFYESLNVFGDKLGPLLLQLSESFSPKHFASLKTFLEQAPKHLQIFVELRHRNWFADDKIRQEVFQMFQGLNTGAVISDTPIRRDCIHMTLPIPHAFIRFVGVGDVSDFKRLNEWVDRIEQWYNKGLQSLYFFIHQEQDRRAPEAADYLIEQFNKRLGLNLLRPQFVDKTLLF